MGGGANAVFLGAVEHRFLSRTAALCWDNALAKMYCRNQAICYY